MKRILTGLLGLLSLIYLVNPGFGVFELLPDAIPGIGNVDEGLAAYVLFSVITYFLGKDIGLFTSMKEQEEEKRQLED